MTERHGMATLEHDLMLLIHKHAWLRMDDWQRACRSIGEGYLEATAPEAHQLTDEAAARFVEGLAASLQGVESLEVAPLQRLTGKVPVTQPPLNLFESLFQVTRGGL